MPSSVNETAKSNAHFACPFDKRTMITTASDDGQDRPRAPPGVWPALGLILLGAESRFRSSEQY